LKEASNISAQSKVITEEDLQTELINDDDHRERKFLTRLEIAVLKRTRRVSSWAERSRL